MRGLPDTRNPDGVNSGPSLPAAFGPSFCGGRDLFILAPGVIVMGASSPNLPDPYEYPEGARHILPHPPLEEC